ncbi:MAG: flagellar assembly protein FliH [Methylococcales bacterium]
MSLSKDFSQSELGNLSLWELPPIQDTRAPAFNRGGAEQDPIPALPTVEEIEAMQKLAFEEASKQGWREGYEKGFEQGRNEGFEQGRSDLDRSIGEFRSLLDLLSEPLNNLDEQVEEELVGLSVAIARHLVRRELKTETDQIIAVIREALQALPASARKIRISLNPDDAELVRSALRVDDARPPWELLEDPLLTRGGCRVETETSRIDATVENRLNQVIAAVLGGERKQDHA